MLPSVAVNRLSTSWRPVMSITSFITSRSPSLNRHAVPLLQHRLNHLASLTLKKRSSAVDNLLSRYYRVEKQTNVIASNDDNRLNWHPVYRLKAMPYIQAFSQMKVTLSTALLLTTPVVGVAFYLDYLDASFVAAFVFATVFSSATLCAFSAVFTKVIGVVSVNKIDNLVRLGHINFWGQRVNMVLQPEELLRPDDYADSIQTGHTVRVGLLNEATNRVETTLFLTRVLADVVDKDRFTRLFGFKWH